MLEHHVCCNATLEATNSCGKEEADTGVTTMPVKTET